MKQLVKGDRCGEVLILQDYLLQLGFLEREDLTGEFDEPTNRALRRFKYKRKMIITGVVDSRTWDELKKAMKELPK
jgi:hypothetical protein